MLKSKPLPIIHLAVLGLFIIIAYYPSLDVPFIFDDMPNIVLNPSVHPQDISDLSQALHSKFSATRPLAMFSFALNYLFGALDEYGYHIVNILIHLINAGLLYFICLDLLKNSRTACKNEDLANIAFFAAALWALNPVQTQAVTYIVQRMTAMATLFYLAAMLTFLRWRFANLSPRLAIIAIPTFFLLGLASKEIVATLPLTLILLELCFHPPAKPRNKTWLWVAAVLFIITAAYYLQGHLPDWHRRYPTRNFSPWQRVMSQWRVLWHYLSLYIFPLPQRLHLTYDLPVSTGLLQPPTTLLSLAAIIATLVTAWLLRHRQPLAAFAILFFFLNNAIEASFINLEMVFVHRLYLPSTFLGLGLLSLVPIQAIKRLGIFLLIIISLLALGTITRNNNWQDKEKFWGSDFDMGGSPARALNNQAAALIDAGNFDNALIILKKAVPLAETHDDLRITLYNSGFANFYAGNFAPSLAYFTAVAERYGPFKDVQLFIGKIYIGQGKTVAAENMAATLKRQVSSSQQGDILLAIIAAKGHEYQRAEDILKNSLAAISPTQVETYMQTSLELARIYLLEKKEKDAYMIFLQITKRFPQNYSAWTMIYRMLQAGGDEEAAGRVARYLAAHGVKIQRPATGKTRSRSLKKAKK